MCLGSTAVVDVGMGGHAQPFMCCCGRALLGKSGSTMYFAISATRCLCGVLCS